MNRDDLLNRVRKILVDEVGVEADEVVGSADLREDLEMDSLDLVELVTVLENELGTSIDQERVGNVRTVDDVIDVVSEVLAARPGDAVAGETTAESAVAP